MIPSQYSLIFTSTQIADGIKKIEPDITSWIREKGDEVVAVCILNGAIYFFADLMRAIPEAVKNQSIRVVSYDVKTNTQLEKATFAPGTEADVKGKRVLLVDDICDSGKLLDELTSLFSSQGATEVRTAVMVYRDVQRSVHRPNYFALKLQSEEWLVGMGLDDKEEWRNLPQVYKINQS